ncbi:MAG TPA: hypothetical protein VGI93_06035 [Steroidobacteraceae bacterium]|jgi:hypothetical protein
MHDLYRARLTCIAIAALAVCNIGVADTQQNTTGLPTYPRDEGSKMDKVARMLPNGQHCTHYSSSTKDGLAAVIDWYKNALPSTRIEDVNKDSLYGSYFKLEGVKLLIGNDIVNVYRLPSDMNMPYAKKDGVKKTSIELFKCQDAPERRPT